MTTSLARSFPRSAADVPRRLLESFARWTASTNGLVWVFVAGIVLRLWLSLGGGFPFDMGTFAAWSDRLATQGPRSLYADPENYFVDYPPGYMYVLLVLGKISRALRDGAPSEFMLKLAADVFDVALAWVVVLLTDRVTPRSLQRRFPWRGLAAAAILLNPAFFWVSAVWGQVDSLQALLVLCGFLFLTTGERTLRRELVGIGFLAYGLITKPQSAFVLPLVVLLLFWRHVRMPMAEVSAAPRSGYARAVRTWLGSSVFWRGIARLAGYGAFAFGFGLLMMAPFGLGISGWLRFYTHAAGTYKYTSVWAFNLWGAVAFWKPDHPSAGAGDVTVFGVPALIAGLILFACGTVLLLARAWRALRDGESEARTLVFGGAAMTCLAFAVLTRIHERYLFLALSCLAPLLAYRALRRVFVVLSILYWINVYFAYVYYVEFVKRKAIRIPGYEALYGVSQDAAQRKLISVITGALCLVVAWLGWRWLGYRREEPAPEADETGPARVRISPWRRSAQDEVAVRRRWELGLHPVGRRGAAAALAAFVLVAITRLIGLASPHGMYFDEVYHARTAGEYIQGKEVYEWTHPPLAKELMALSVTTVGAYGVRGKGPLFAGLGDGPAASDGTRVVWVSRDGLRSGRFGDDCEVRSSGSPVRVSVTSPTAVAPVPGGTLVGGTGPQGPALVRVEGGRERWGALLGSAPVEIAALDAGAYVRTEDRRLYLVGQDGSAREVASGVEGLSAVREDGLVFASFPDTQSVTAYDAAGATRYASNVQGRPRAVIGSADADRALVADASSPRIESIDTESKTRSDELLGASPSAFALIPETGIVWAQTGRSLRAIEPRGLSVIGGVELPDVPLSLLTDRRHQRIVAVTENGLVCAGGKPAFAWRLGSALFGALTAAFAMLLALRATGSTTAGWLAVLFVAVDGLLFTISRIAMNDAFVTAFILIAWFCVLSATYRWGSDPAVRSRPAAIGWLAAAGLAFGAAGASKWVGVYALAGAGVFVLADLLRRKREGLLGIAGHPVASLAVLAVCFAVLPIGVYVASYVPYFSLGHDVGELLQTQKGMYAYHAHLTATHPYGSPWWGWPIGRKAVYLFLGQRGTEQAQIWTIANPVVFVGGAVGLALLAGAAVRRRSIAMAAVVAAAAAQYVPWMAVTRVTFLYHYTPVVPFLAIGLAWWAAEGRKGSRWHRFEMAAIAVAAIAAFLLTLPMLDGWYVPAAYQNAVKGWLGWMF